MNTIKLFKNNKQVRKMLTAAGGNLFGSKKDHSRIITTGGAGYILPHTQLDKATIRQNLYDNLSPHSYQSLSDAFKSILGINTGATHTLEDISVNPQAEQPIDDAIWATYLGIPKSRRHKNSPKLFKSKYAPSKGKDNVTYYKFPLIDGINYIVKEGTGIPIGNNKVTNMDSSLAGIGNVGDYTIGHGYDKQGEYVSVYDKWDINPFKGSYKMTGPLGNIGNLLFGNIDDLSFGIGKPVHLYDRIYLDDYYGVKEPTHATYLPEVIVTGKKKQEGKMNIIKQFKNGGLIRKMQTAAGGPLRLTPAELKYLEWSKMTPELKREYRTNRAKSHLLSGPNITNFWEAFQTYIGNRDPKNPYLQTGDVPTPGMRNPTNIVKGVQTAATVAKKAPSLILSYFEVVPRFINKVKNFNGVDKVGRTISAATKLINPNYTKTLAKSPELVDHINLYNFKKFNTKQLQDFLKVWSSEASKAPFSLDGMLQYDTTPDKIKDLPKHFEEARKILKGIDLGKRYGRVISRKYQLMYDQITDPTLRHIADTSPQYIPELFLQQKQFGGATEKFMKGLIKRSNSYRRFMTKPSSAEDFATFKGSGLVQDGNKSARLINVEGRMRSDFNGEYGSYPGYYEGQPQLKGDMSTWWDLRVPLGVNVKEGIWSENPTINKFRTRLHEKYSDNGISAAERAFWENYSAPRKFIDWPTHQVFFGPEGSLLLGFKVTTEMPKGFTFGKGYKQGGKMNIIKLFKEGGQIRKMLTASGGPIKKPIKRLKDGYRYIPDEKNGGWDRISDNSMADVFATMEFTPKKTKVGSSITRKQSAPSKIYYNAYNSDNIMDAIRRRLYRNITPFGYHNPISRTSGAIALNQQDDTRTEENKRIKDSVPEASALDALWATYLNIPENQRRNINPKYGISKTKDGYYRFNSPGMIFNFELDLSPHGFFELPGRKAVMMNGILGNYTTGLGRDTKGDYIFYSDSRLNPDGTPDIKTGWDINPYSNTVDNDTEETTEEYGQYGQDKKDLSYKIGKALFGNVEDISMGVGTPVPIYDKIYLDDIYNVPKKERRGYYLPEITVTGKKKQRDKTHITKLFKNGGLIRKMLTASGGPITRYETLPNIEVVGYRPIELKTYKPLHKDYPFTGHSSLDIPIDEDSAYTQGWYSPYGISVDKTSNSKDYNLVTNNCADATLGALNYIFGTKEKPLLFTTPGDVRDYAINKLHGKVTRDKDGIDTILIPRNKNNAKKISKKALEWAKNKDENTIYEFEYKQGGKMNILEFLKNGSGIHIKEKNKGKFTSYCGGKVTDECIRKAKASGNPTLVKRATFAANARKWKHKNGGIVVKAADGTKTTNFFLKVGNFLNSDLGKTVGTGLVNAFSSWTSSNKLNNAIDSWIEGLKKQNKADINSIQDWALQKATEEITLKFNELLLLFNSGASFEQPSPRVFEHLKSQLANKYAQKAINYINLNSQEDIANLESLKTNPTSDVFSSLVNTGFDYLSNKFANKALDKNGVPSSRNTSASFYSNPYLKTLNKVGTINFDGSMNTGIGGTTYNWKTNTFGSNNSLFKF